MAPSRPCPLTRVALAPPPTQRRGKMTAVPRRSQAVNLFLSHGPLCTVLAVLVRDCPQTQLQTQPQANPQALHWDRGFVSRSPSIPAPTKIYPGTLHVPWYQVFLFLFLLISGKASKHLHLHLHPPSTLPPHHESERDPQRACFRRGSSFRGRSCPACRDTPPLTVTKVGCGVPHHPSTRGSGPTVISLTHTLTHNSQLTTAARGSGPRTVSAWAVPRLADDCSHATPASHHYYRLICHRKDEQRAPEFHIPCRPDH